ncbi:MAG: hypothetical protein ACI398_04170 [Clostridium sp.]
MAITNYEEAIRPAKEVIEVIKDFFGEDNVDAQIPEYEEFEEDIFIPILIHWDRLNIVCNETRVSEPIYDLFARFNINGAGIFIGGHFSLARTTYTGAQYKVQYMHSHCPLFPKSNPCEFLTPCFGTGPIRDTIFTLGSCRDLNIWGLFCQELDNYIRVESLVGIPYIRISTIHKRDSADAYNSLCQLSTPILKLLSNLDIALRVSVENTIKNIFKEYLKNTSIKLSYINNSYSLGEPKSLFTIRFSTYLINKMSKTDPYIIETMIRRALIMRCTIINNIIYSIDNTLNGSSYNLPNCGIIFRGNKIPLRIIDSDASSIEESLILANDIIDSLLTSLFKFINYNYGKAEADINRGEEII